MVVPTLRQKKRYVHLRFECPCNISENEAQAELYGALLSFLGELGFSRANPKLVEFNSTSKSGILKCSNAEIQNVKAALALVNRVKGENGCIRILKVSGSVSKLMD
ncbi:MAG: hypothetical protein NTY73_01355 [Candidatus Micrarchaeota archaeon]|nr:hypothetical protein [Candidatus Micrarchaeota archaeon]